MLLFCWGEKTQNVCLVDTTQIRNSFPDATYFVIIVITGMGCQSAPLKKPETDGENLKRRVNLNQNRQKNGLKIDKNA